MNKNKKGIMSFVKSLGSKKTKKEKKFCDKVLNLIIRRIEGENFKFDGNAVYSSDMSILVCVFKTEGTFTIPEGVTTIGKRAFCNKKELKNIIIPSSVRVIEKKAFYGCDNITEVFIPATVEKVKAHAFAACDSLRKVTFAGVLSHLSHHTFDNSNELRLILVPQGSVRACRRALHISDADEGVLVAEGERPEQVKADNNALKTKETAAEKKSAEQTAEKPKVAEQTVKAPAKKAAGTAAAKPAQSAQSAKPAQSKQQAQAKQENEPKNK